MSAKNKDIKEQQNASAEYWKERFEEASGWVAHFSDKSNRLEAEVEFYMDYIRWKGLSEEYQFFEEHAHKEEFPDEPFARYVM